VDKGSAKLYMKRKKDGTVKKGVKADVSLAAGSTQQIKKESEAWLGDQGDQPTLMRLRARQ
jgi:hypothetical protein